MGRRRTQKQLQQLRGGDNRHSEPGVNTRRVHKARQRHHTQTVYLMKTVSQQASASTQTVTPKQGCHLRVHDSQH